MSDRKFDERNMSEGTWLRIWVRGGVLEGPWKFTSQGTIDAYPRFVDRVGVVIPWHAVIKAER
ncbi:MAG TPA: hypothetical protein VMT27_07740 [Actinomycetes bacterium]|nr:hypothetical protein [Actinomycetes bacterium]